MDDLIDTLDTDHWCTASPSRTKHGFKEYQIIKQVRVDDVTMRVIINAEDEDPKNVLLHCTRPTKNPLRSVGRCLIKLSNDEKTIVGISVEGDVVLSRSCRS